MSKIVDHHLRDAAPTTIDDLSGLASSGSKALYAWLPRFDLRLPRLIFTSCLDRTSSYTKALRPVLAGFTVRWECECDGAVSAEQLN
jgi:hypothetical protein